VEREAGRALEIDQRRGSAAAPLRPSPAAPGHWQQILGRAQGRQLAQRAGVHWNAAWCSGRPEASRFKKGGAGHGVLPRARLAAGCALRDALDQAACCWCCWCGIMALTSFSAVDCRLPLPLVRRAVLADGHLVARLLRAVGTAIGEVVFNTGMTGYRGISHPATSVVVTFTLPENWQHDQCRGSRSRFPQCARRDARQLARPQAAGASALLASCSSANGWWNPPGGYRALVRRLRDAAPFNGRSACDASDPHSALEKQVTPEPSMEGLNLPRR